jgi:hypothetical protein
LHDTVWFEVQGVPSVAIASSEFADAAATQAKALGMAQARYVCVAHPIQDATDDEMRAKADAVVEQVIAALTAPAAPAVSTAPLAPAAAGTASAANEDAARDDR